MYATLRWLHVYISMLSFLAIFFFAVTGVTLNHPDWTFGMSNTEAQVTGELPEGWRSGDEVDWLGVAEHLRSEHNLRGSVTDYRLDDFEGFVSFRGPGFAADAYLDPETGGYELSVFRAGTVGVLNALHAGIDDRLAWSRLIDVAGALLAILSLTGIGILLFLKRFRRGGLLAMLGGSVVLAFFVLVALR